MDQSALAAQQQEFDALTSQMAEINGGLLIAPEEHRPLHTRVLHAAYDRAVEFLVNNPELARHYRELGELATRTNAEQIAVEEVSLEQLHGYVKEGLLSPEDIAQAAGELALKKQALETGDDFSVYASLFGDVVVEEVSEPTADPEPASSKTEVPTPTDSTTPEVAQSDQSATKATATPKPRRRGSSKELSASAAEEFVTPGWRHFNLDDARRLGIVDRETGQVLLSKLDEATRTVVKYSLLNENGFRMERLRKDVSEFIGLAPKEWDAFKNHFRDTQQLIEAALLKAGVKAKWHEVGQRRGQRYRLSIEEQLDSTDTVTAAAASTSTPPPVTPPTAPSATDTITPPTPPAANVPAPDDTGDSTPRERYLARQAAERLFNKQCTFAVELAAGIKEMLQKDSEGQVRRSRIIMQTARELGPEVSRDEVEAAIDNLLANNLLFKGRPNGGSRTISLFQDKTERVANKNDNGNAECKKPGALTEAEQALVPAVLDHLVSLKLEQGDTVKGVHAIVSLTHKDAEVETVRSVIRKLERAGTIRTEADRNYGRGRKGMLAVMDNMDKRNAWRNSPSLVIAEVNAELAESARK